MTAIENTSAENRILPLATRTENFIGSIIDSSVSLLASYDHDIVKFGMGAPAPDMLPAEQFARIAAEAFIPDSFSYGPTEGTPILASALLDYLQDTGQIPPEQYGRADRIVITTGGMQGLDLAFKLFTNPGDLVFSEAPTYTNGSATALSYQADLIEVPVDEHGMQVDLLEELTTEAGRSPAVIYTVPTFQNPAGVTMTQDRREKLLDFAHRHNTMLVEDDPYGILRFSGEHIPTLSQLSPNDPLVFGVRTFSKFVAPGLRIGWVDADPALRQLLINAKQTMDSCTNVPTQHMVAHWLRAGGIDQHVSHLREQYRARKNVMVEGLQKHFGEEITSTDPEGGFFLWVTFADETIDVEQLQWLAIEEGVAFIPGPAFSTAGRFTNALRLCFASNAPDRIEEGLVRLRRAVDRYLAER